MQYQIKQLKDFHNSDISSNLLDVEFQINNIDPLRHTFTAACFANQNKIEYESLNQRKLITKSNYKNYNKKYLHKKNIQFEISSPHNQLRLHSMPGGHNEQASISFENHLKKEQTKHSKELIQPKIINVELEIHSSPPKLQKQYYRLIKQHQIHFKTESYRNHRISTQGNSEDITVNEKFPIKKIQKIYQKRRLRNNGLPMKYCVMNSYGTQIKSNRNTPNTKNQVFRILGHKKISVYSRQKQKTLDCNDLFMQYSLVGINKKPDMHGKSLVYQKVTKSSIDETVKSIVSDKNDYIQYVTKRKTNKKDHFVFSLDAKITPSENKIDYYRDFLWKINFSNNLFVEPVCHTEKQFKIFIGPGNNSSLIKGLIRRRFWWVIQDKVTEQTNFIWTQLKNTNFFNYQKTGRIMQDKKNQKECKPDSVSDYNTQLQEIDISQKKIILKPSIEYSKNTMWHAPIFSISDLQLWTNYYQKNQKIEDELNQKIYLKRSKLLKQKNAIKIQKPQLLKMHNHFDCNYFLGNKKAMFYSLRKYYQLTNKNVFQYIPLTFHITKGINDNQYKKFILHYNKIQDFRKINKSIKNIWIVKPGEYTNRGQGITVCSTLDDVIVRLKGRQKNSNGSLRTFIVQKYIEKPLLYFKRKFDIRHYMMITCINGEFKGYWYAEGYIRTTSYQYSLNNCKDNYIHLTNDAIQKNSEEYGKFQKGNKISYSEFQKYLDTHQKKHKIKFSDILKQMENIAAIAIKSTYHLLDSKRRSHNFQIFGMDFMIDSDFHPWLIQINTNPCLELACPLLARIIPAMLQNSFKLTIDPLFQAYDWPSNKKYHLGDSPLQNNKFKLIFDEATEGSALQQLYKNIERIDKNMGFIEQQDDQYVDEGKQWHEQI